MKEGTLVIGDKTYLSSARAAELFGYTKDYVGQLCRGGKVDAQLIGRSWYVAEDSVRKHKLSVHYTLTKPKKSASRESDASEKANVLIDISAVREHETIARAQPPHHAEVVEEKDERSDDSDSSEWLPRLAKGGAESTSPLVETKISFEKEEPLDFDGAEEVVSVALRRRAETSVEPQDDDSVVNIRSNVAISRDHKKPVVRTVRHEPRNVHAHAGAPVAMDGVVAQQSESRLRVDRPIVQHICHERTMNVDSRSDNLDVYQDESFDEERSYVVPVLSALIVAVAFVIAYVLLS